MPKCKCPECGFEGPINEFESAQAEQPMEPTEMVEDDGMMGSKGGGFRQKPDKDTPKGIAIHVMMADKAKAKKDVKNA